MRIIIIPATLVAGMLTAALASPAQAQQSASVAEAPEAPTPRVVVYPHAYFKDFRPDTAMDMISRLPGFSFENGSNVRGFAGADGNVRLEGELPASRSDSMYDILRRIPASSVERIELITSGSKGIDMQGKSLVANVVRRKDVGVKATAISGVDVYQDGRTAPTFRLEGQKQSGAHLIEGALYYDEDLDGGVGPRVRGPLASPITSTWDGRARYPGYYGGTLAYETPAGAGRLRINALLNGSGAHALQQDFPDSGFTVAPSAEATDRDFRNAELGLRYSRDYAGGANVQLVAYQKLGQALINKDFVQGAVNTAFDQNRETSESILRVTGRARKIGGWTFDGGAEVALNTLDSVSALTSGGAPVFLPAANVKVEELRGEVFATGNWALKPTLNLQFGLRWEASNITSTGAVSLDKTLSYPKPRMIATWSPAKGHIATLRLEREIGQLSFDQFSASATLTTGVVIAGNPNLEPVTSTTIDTRYEWRFGQRGAIALFYRQRHFDNPTGRVILNGPGGPYEAPGNTNPGTRQRYGFSADLPLNMIHIPGGLIHIEQIVVESTTRDDITGAERRISGEAKGQLIVQFSQDIPGSKFRWGLGYDKLALTTVYLPSEIDTALGEALISAFVEYRPSPNITWRLDGLNLTDRTYTTTREVYSATRDVGVGNYRERYDLDLSQGGAGVRLTLRKTLR